MPRATELPLKEALAAYSVNLRNLLLRDSLSQAGLGKAMKARGRKVSTKTINNIVEQRKSPELGKLSAIAAQFDVPLWVMFVPNLPPALLQKPALTRLKLLVENYIACNDTERGYTENMAAGYAGLRKPK